MIYAEDLERMAASGCQGDGCDHRGEPLFLHARCHVSGRIEVSYSKGVLRVGCQECGEAIAEVAVARNESVHDQGAGST